MTTNHKNDTQIPWELIDTAPIPGQGTELQLFQREGEFSISILDGGVLMSTWAHQSEDALAQLPCAKIVNRNQPRVLIGGLGMGFTLAAALKTLGPEAKVVVAELVPGLIEWNRGTLGKYAGHPLQDPRTQVRVGDVAKVLREQRQAYDAILLDVDNGPHAITRKKNNWLYTTDGLTEAYRALRPEGILAIWSAGPDREFMQRLQKIGFKVKQVRVREHQNKGDLHAIWFAEREAW
ncbi:Methyltransferase domain-containing protein [Desulfuromusa kysingii]|uniref:Methyltransferase domain-containing protein n=1 Tax=Desulfuromusa kysingii TaxID=37625 RepID=A0A1H3X2S1_9BACT|nr:MnmC family methyltransferase [Desulfuromusa kysingii]SDZ93560.1 Methyltransferase domain-containing protein [Desulfuromusa kysingii]